jgi:hypothetical protein
MVGNVLMHGWPIEPASDQLGHMVVAQMAHVVVKRCHDRMSHVRRNVRHDAGVWVVHIPAYHPHEGVIVNFEVSAFFRDPLGASQFLRVAHFSCVAGLEESAQRLTICICFLRGSQGGCAGSTCG